MNAKHISILIVLFSIAIAIAWDVLVALSGHPDDTWCQAIRELNRQSGGLLMCCAIGAAVHIFCNQWFPTAWGGPR
jgi:hypothetical protein